MGISIVSSSAHWGQNGWHVSSGSLGIERNGPNVCTGWIFPQESSQTRKSCTYCLLTWHQGPNGVNIRAGEKGQEQARGAGQKQFHSLTSAWLGRVLKSWKRGYTGARKGFSKGVG